MDTTFVKQGIKPRENYRRLKSFAWASAILGLVFCVPLYDLLWFAARSQLYSYILLIPFISAYLIWPRRFNLPSDSIPARKTATLLFIAGAVVLAIYWLVLRNRFKLLDDDYLAVMVIDFLLFLLGLGCWFFGGKLLRTVTFPVAFIIFMIPIPAFLVSRIDTFLQFGSAWAAQGFFWLSGMPSLHDGVAFQLPGISLKIAPECSGIHSSLVLFITSLLAGYLFLRSPWKRTLLAVIVIPLALIRNGFRVFVIGELCVHIGPQMINSYIHRKGGPIFFVLSLIPFFLLLLLLKKSEQTWKKSGNKTSEE
jgi:exosortase C (VPDSG-CTERM-specific)